MKKFQFSVRHILLLCIPVAIALSIGNQFIIARKPGGTIEIYAIRSNWVCHLPDPFPLPPLQPPSLESEPIAHLSAPVAD